MPMPVNKKPIMSDDKCKAEKEVYLDEDPIVLPDNAFRELGADEQYRPVMHPARDYAEVTPYSLTMGLVLAVIFSAAAAYLGLRVGQEIGRAHVSTPVT